MPQKILSILRGVDFCAGRTYLSSILKRPWEIAACLVPWCSQFSGHQFLLAEMGLQGPAIHGRVWLVQLWPCLVFQEAADVKCLSGGAAERGTCLMRCSAALISSAFGLQINWLSGRPASLVSIAQHDFWGGLVLCVVFKPLVSKQTLSALGTAWIGSFHISEEGSTGSLTFGVALPSEMHQIT